MTSVPDYQVSVLGGDMDSFETAGVEDRGRVSDLLLLIWSLLTADNKAQTQFQLPSRHQRIPTYLCLGHQLTRKLVTSFAATQTCVSRASVCTKSRQ